MTLSSELIGRRIVVIDNDPGQASTLAVLLRLEGVEASHEHDAKRALERLLADPPEAIVINVKMPDLSGPELLATLRATHPKLPAVLVTGLEEDDPRVRPALEREHTAYLMKPLELARLFEELVMLLAGRRSQRAPRKVEA